MTMRYVAGFLMEGDSVYLVRKLQPAQLAGKLNGIGGKVQLGEDPLKAMSREFFEETGVGVTQWRQFCVLHGCYELNVQCLEDFEVYFYSAFISTIFRQYITHQHNDVGEFMQWYVIDDILRNAMPLGLMPNCTWLIPMARSFSWGERADSFIVGERYKNNLTRRN